MDELSATLDAYAYARGLRDAVAMPDLSPQTIRLHTGELTPDGDASGSGGAEVEAAGTAGEGYCCR